MARAGSARILRWALVACVAIAGSDVAVADPVLSVHSPVVEQGEWELEFNGGVQGFGAGERQSAGKVAIGYGFLPRLRTELEAEYAKTPGRADQLAEVELENFLMLTPARRRGLIVGLFVELQREQVEDRNTVTLGPLFQFDGARTRTNVNFLVKRRVNRRADADQSTEPGQASRTQLAYQLQWQYKLRRGFRPGLQAFGKLGSPGHVRSTELRAGPAMFGALRLARNRELEYNAAILGGMTRGTADLTLRVQLEYQFR